MLIPIIYNRGLSKEVLKNIENRKYSVKEIIAFHKEIKNKYTNKKKGYLSAIIAVMICAAFVIILGLMSDSSGTAALYSIIGVVVAIAIAMTYVKKNFVEKAKKQFERAVKKGYPELADEFSSNFSY